MSAKNIIKLAEKYSLKLADLQQSDIETRQLSMGEKDRIVNQPNVESTMGFAPTIPLGRSEERLDDPPKYLIHFGYQLTKLLRLAQTEIESDILALKYSDFFSSAKTGELPKVFIGSYHVLKNLDKTISACIHMPRQNPMAAANAFINYISDNGDSLMQAKNLLDTYLVNYQGRSPSTGINEAIQSALKIKEEISALDYDSGY